MFTPAAMWQQLQTYISDGGFVMLPLLILSVVLWFCLGDRLLRLRRGAAGPISALIESGTQPSQGVLGEAWHQRDPVLAMDALEPQDKEALLAERLWPIRMSLSTHRAVIRSIVVIAPLAGLLGTVAGMIETFDSLGDGALFAASGGIAGGISQALLTTQMGLVVAIPGVIAGRMLDRKQLSLESDLDALQANMATSGGSTS